MSINWDEYYAKHCARYYGWLPASKAFKKKRKKALKYFTLCGEQAIDIFMLESAKVLQRDKNGMLPNVTICERDEEQVPEILKLIRPPLGIESIIPRSLEKVLTFKDDDSTRDRTIDDIDSEEPPSLDVRKKLRLKDFAHRIKNAFPFDIINFDPCNNLLKRFDNPLYRAFENIFSLQQSIDSFLLLLTTPISYIHVDFKTRFRRDFDSNVTNYAEIKNVLFEIFPSDIYDEISEKKRIAICMAKSIIMTLAKKHNWHTEHQGIYIYENKDRRWILSLVVELSRAEQGQHESNYVQEVIKVIKYMPKLYPYEESLENQEIQADLQAIVDYRERIRKEYRFS